MIDEPIQPSGKINWPVALAVSLGLHVVLLGVLWMTATPAKDSGDVKPSASREAAAPQPAASETPADNPPQDLPPARTETPPARTDTPPARTETSTRPLPPPHHVTETTGGSAGAGATTEIYIVAPGDGLERIARKHGCTVDELKALNGKAALRLQPNQRLKVPVKR